MRIKGEGGHVSLDDVAVTFEFKGFLASRAQKAASPRRIPLETIAVAEYVESVGMSLGYLRVWLTDAMTEPPHQRGDINALQYGSTDGEMRRLAVEINRRIGAPTGVPVAGGRVVRTDLIDAMQRAGVALGAGGEIKHLPPLLRPDERVLELAVGRYQGNTAVVVLSDVRLFFFDKGEPTEEFALADITELEAELELLGVELEVHAGQRGAEIERLTTERARAIVDAIRVRRPTISVDIDLPEA